MQAQQLGQLSKMQEISHTNGSQTPVLRNDSGAPTVHPDNHSPKEPRIRCRPVRPEDQTAESNIIRFTYLAEGAANVVFRIEPGSRKASKELVFVDERDRVLPPADFLDKVLRISKGNAKSPKCQDIITGLQKVIRPLFRPDEVFQDHLLAHEGILLSEVAVVELIDELGKQGTALGHSIRSEEQWGILLPDMSTVLGSSVTIEIKPKWLLQSPNAPRDAYRCRTCALQLTRQNDKHAWSYLCPLQLLAGNDTMITQFITYKVLEEYRALKASRPDEEMLTSIVKRTKVYLTSGPGKKLLLHLRTRQAELDRLGILERDRIFLPNLFDYYCRLRLAMTLRDCSLFIKVPIDESVPIESKLGDLDLKSSAKIEDWHQKEESLVNGGWYTNIEREVLDAGPDHCLISAGWKKYVPHYW